MLLPITIEDANALSFFAAAGQPVATSMDVRATGGLRSK